MHGQEELLARLQHLQPGERAVFLIGSGVTIPEVPGSEEITTRVSETLVDSEEQYRKLSNMLVGTPHSLRYSAAMRYFTAVRGPVELNRLIQSAVLKAVHRGTRVSIVPTTEELKELERKHQVWSLNAGIEVLGRLIWSRRDLFPGPVLTTNFDPLIEISLRRAGADPVSVILAEDGDPEQVATGHDAPVVVHLHGWWRGTGDTLHTAEHLARRRPRLQQWLESILREYIIIVLGYGGWQDIFMSTLQAAPASEIKQIYWCFYEEDHEIPGEKLERIEQFSGHSRVTCLAGIDVQKLLPTLWKRLGGRAVPTAPIEPHDKPTTWKAAEIVSPTNQERAPAAPASVTRRAAIAGLAVVAAGGLGLWYYPKQKKIRVSVVVEDDPAHLGDNVFETLLAPDPAQIPDPLSPGRGDLVFFDKDKLSFEARSVSTGQAALLAYLSEVFSHLDFSSYRHVRLATESEVRALGLEPVPSPRVVPLAKGFLVWVRDQGNYHQRWAAVLLSHRVDLGGRIRAGLPLPGEFQVDRIVLAVEISHGGRPAGEGGEILICVNGRLIEISSRLQSEAQRRETVEVEITPWVDLNRGPTELSVVTTPIREATPVPGPQDPDPRARPVHFRDVMINRMVLLVDVAVEN